MTTVRKHVCEKRADDRGWVIDPIVPPPDGEPLGHAHLASLEPGAIRGNHVHSGAAEFVLVWGGVVEIAWEEGGRVAREEAGGDALVVYEIPAGVAHAVTNVGDTTAYLIAYYFGSPEGGWPETARKPIT
jgi:dTDP-4-dehydrorhamnose 3,5-epimerase-like enzyme